MSCHLHDAFNTLAREIRKVNRARRFNRAKPARRCAKMVAEYWVAGIDALWEYMAAHDRWQALREQTVQKALSDSDRSFLTRLLANFGYFDDVEKKAQSIIQATSIPTFEEAGKFALRQIGVAASTFDLRNQAILDRLIERKDAAIFSTRSFIDEALSTIATRFHELGESAYSSEMLADLRKVLGYRADWEARRFAVTETGIAAELAQVETYRRNGVEGKQWNILDQNTRPSHQALSGAIVKVDDKFDVGGFPADHPLDPKLPPEELVNCHCWLSPVVDEDFEVNAESIWEGQ
jgi:SPP1 gp7 family putative phage head morphogenesis protein